MIKLLGSGKHLGLTAKQVDSYVVQLTVEGADYLEACKGALKFWRRLEVFEGLGGKPQKVDHRFFATFEHYSPDLFAEAVVTNVYDALKQLCPLNELDEEYTGKMGLRWLKAAIVWHRVNKNEPDYKKFFNPTKRISLRVCNH